MAAPIKIAVIGCGRVADHYVKILKSGVVSEFQVVACCDLDGDKANRFAENFQAKPFTNLESMLDATTADLVFVLTPSGLHYEHAKLSLGHGFNTLVEKPITLIPEQGRELDRLAQEKSLMYGVVFQNRYNKAVARVRKALDNDELGDIRIVSVRVRWCRPQRYYDLAPWRGTFSHDGGALTNQCIHHVDLLRYLGGEIVRVNASMRTLGAEIEVEDTVVATMEYGSGAVGVLEGTTAARPDDFEASLSIVGSKGLAQIGGIAVNELQIFTPSPGECASHSEDFLGIEGHGAVYGFGHSDMYRDIAAHFAGKAPYPVSREDCIATLRLLHGFYRSDEAGDWVDVQSPEQSSRLGRPDDEISNHYRTPPLEVGGN